MTSQVESIECAVVFTSGVSKIREEYTCAVNTSLTRVPTPHLVGMREMKLFDGLSAQRVGDKTDTLPKQFDFEAGKEVGGGKREMQ